jgi:hypothetical protein
LASDAASYAGLELVIEGGPSWVSEKYRNKKIHVCAIKSIIVKEIVILRTL